MKRTRIATLTIGTALAAIGAASAGTYLPGEGDIDVRVFQTTETHAFRELDTSPFTGHLYTNRAPIDVDAAETRGTYKGLGVSMTDASAWILSKLSPEKRRAILEAVFSPSGANLRGVRLNIGASDYSTALYNYNETPGDVEMRHFSVARDDHWLFPMVKEAMAIRPDLFLFAAPWSPPSWMKTTGNFVDGHFKDGMEQALANYLLAYVKACRERGLAISALTFQNESALSTHGTYPSCVFTPKQGAEVTKLFVKGARAAGIATEAWIWDWDYHGATNAVAAQLADPELRAAASAVAWHSYSSMKPEMYALKKRYPEIRYYHTEMGPALHDNKRRTEHWWCGKMREAFENGCEAFTSWNLCLTDTGEPLVGPHLCAGFLEVDLETGDFKPSAQYTVFRHVGPFVKPGATVLKADGDEDGTNVMLFRNPDGAHVLVVACVGESPNPDKKKRPRPRLYVKYNGEHKYLPLPWGKWSVTTMVFKKRP